MVQELGQEAFRAGNLIMEGSVALKRGKNQMLAPNIAVNNGHDQAHLVRQLGADEDGHSDIVEHQIVHTQRMVDRLYERGLLNDRHDDRTARLRHLAASMLRDDYERAGLAMGKMRAVSGERMSGGGEPLYVTDEESWRRYNQACRQCKQWFGVLRYVVIDDQTPEQYGARTRSHGILMLHIGLDALIKHYGLVAERRGK